MVDSGQMPSQSKFKLDMVEPDDVIDEIMGVSYSDDGSRSNLIMNRIRAVTAEVHDATFEAVHANVRQLMWMARY